MRVRVYHLLPAFWQPLERFVCVLFFSCFFSKFSILIRAYHLVDFERAAEVLCDDKKNDCVPFRLSESIPSNLNQINN